MVKTGYSLWFVKLGLGFICFEKHPVAQAGMDLSSPPPGSQMPAIQTALFPGVIVWLS